MADQLTAPQKISASEFLGPQRRYYFSKGICEMCHGFISYWTKRKDYDEKVTLCFTFRADCGGDAFHLCNKHMAEALTLLDRESSSRLTEN